MILIFNSDKSLRVTDVQDVTKVLCNSLHAKFLTSLLKLHAGGSGVRPYDGPDIKLFI